jgi:hypothetical protein
VARLGFHRKGRIGVRVIVVQDLDPRRASSYTVANYVWAVLKVRALGRALGQAWSEVERSHRTLESRREAELLRAEAQTLLRQLEAEADGDDTRPDMRPAAGTCP